MNKLNKRIIVAVSAFAMTVAPVSPAFAGSYNFNISGNGADSKNDVELKNSNTTQVFQENKSDITNKVNISSNTGDNNASKNTGGGVSVTTGDVDVVSYIENQVGSNEAHVEACDCDADIDVSIEGNGAGSRNDVSLRNTQENTVSQNNQTRLRNDVDVDSNTGGNRASKNTGGYVEVETGRVDVASMVSNRAGSNTAHIGNGSGYGSMIDLVIEGNGAKSRNEIDIRNKQANSIFQNNNTRINNNLDVDSNTGENNANYNTGAGVDVMTGDVVVEAGILNEAGFNYADVDCGCVLDVAGSISENGSKSKNEIDLRLDNDTVATQDNYDRFRNYSDILSDTGYNNLYKNTGGDHEVRTGMTWATFVLDNFGGLNLFGV